MSVPAANRLAIVTDPADGSVEASVTKAAANCPERDHRALIGSRGYAGLASQAARDAGKAARLPDHAVEGGRRDDLVHGDIGARHRL